jgi:hypothetical protein
VKRGHLEALTACAVVFTSKCGSATLLDPLGGRTTYFVGLGVLMTCMLGFFDRTK